MTVDSFTIHPFKSMLHKLKTNGVHYNLDFQVGAQAAPFIDLNIIQIQLIASGSGFDKDEDDKKIPICDILTSFDFEIDGMKKMIKDDVLEIPYGLSFTIQTIAYSTTRGILFEKMANSAIGTVVLPLVDLSNVNKADLTLRFEKVSEMNNTNKNK